MKKCIEIRIEGRKPVRRPRNTLVENEEADMAEQEIDREDVRDGENGEEML